MGTAGEQGHSVGTEMGMDATTVQRVRRFDLVPGYRLIQLLGKGGMGEVHQAEQLSLGRKVAVKLLNPDLATDDTFVARFEKEGAALASLRHPNIVSIVDRGRNADTYFLVMEYVDGPSLRERMREPDFDSMAALRVLTQVARAIDYAHGRGVIHRDLKPENILFDDQAGGLAKVTDFGLAGLDERSDVKDRHNLTQTHMSMGTAAYMAPEQRVDAKTAGPRADLYSLGVMLYELLVGDLPMGTFDPPSVRRPTLDKRLDPIVARCLKPAVEDRYPSVAAFLAELEPLIPMTVGPQPAKETPGQRVVRKGRAVLRSIWRGVTVAAAAAALIIVATVYARSRIESKRLPPGVAVMNDFGVTSLSTSAGRFDKDVLSLELGAGPDTIATKAFGRQPVIKDGVITFTGASAPAGRIELDAETGGDGVIAKTIVDTQASEVSAFEPLLSLFRGPRPEARSALLLLGDHDRYVALIISANGSDPLLDWSLGPEKRGQMTAPLPTGAKNVALELRIDPVTGALEAVIGADRDARVLGDSLSLGTEWKELFGAFPRVGVGCIEGTCVFRGLSLEGSTKPTPAPPPVLETLVAPPPLAPALPGRGKIRTATFAEKPHAPAQKPTKPLNSKETVRKPDPKPQPKRK